MVRHPTEEEKKLWRAAAMGVALPQAVETQAVVPTVPPATKRRTAPLVPLEPRVAAKQPHRRIEGRIDLHGMTQTQAHDALTQFLERTLAAGARRVEIITGKGANGEGALKRLVPLWLEQSPWRGRISHIAYAPAKKGGEGALHVLFRK